MISSGSTFEDRLRSLYYDTCLYTQDSIELLLRAVGVDRCLFGSEKPGTGSVRDPETGRWRRADPGDVLVIANDGRTDVSCWGGILTVAAGLRGIGGVVIDGACRDIGESHELDFPVFGRAVVPVSARGRIVQLDMAVPVEFAGVTVMPGDLVLADRNGVVFVPADRGREVITLAERIVARETAMAEAVRAGRPVGEVMHDSKFPTLEDAP